MTERKMVLGDGDALIVVDLQNDFLPGGSLEVPGSREIVDLVNRYIALFDSKGLPVYATRDWHPKGHASFKDQGGPWPEHCVQGEKGAQFSIELKLPESCVIISTASELDRDAYSGFEGTDLNERLRKEGVGRLFICGLATDYCVFHTVKDAGINGYETFLLEDAVRAVNVQPDDGEKAIKEMTRLGAVSISISDLS
ncbi:MAG: isochorismatase family protein [Deltaproteobacteria bacterium]|nr:isochorismatase family protein [Deltaproteobacteria bacterium]